MATTLSPDATLDLAAAARIFHALSDDTRLEIVAMLVPGERCVCELMSALDAAQSRLSFHLKVLKDAGIVLDRRDGRWVHYSLNKSAFEDAAGVIKALKPRRRVPVIEEECCK
jgi:ArsR family transcriptional regulator